MAVYAEPVAVLPRALPDDDIISLPPCRDGRGGLVVGERRVNHEFIAQGRAGGVVPAGVHVEVGAAGTFVLPRDEKVSTGVDGDRGGDLLLRGMGVDRER